MYSRFLLPFVWILSWSASYAQVIINEISYNPPEAGIDSLEYIEIYNAGVTMVDITGWHFLAGVEDTFPAVELEPGEYFVTAVNAQAMMKVFGIVVHQWSGDALNNGGELIQLADAGGSMVDEVTYDDADPWPTEPDGGGPSLELKSPELDNNDGANWQFSGGNTGVIINGFEVSGTPGAENSGGGTQGPDLNIELAGFAFEPNIAVIEVGDVVRWVNNSPVIHNVNGQQSIFPGNPASFFSGNPIGGPWQYDFEFLLPGIYHYRCDVHSGMGMTGTIYVYDPAIYNDFPLADLRLVNENGSALFDGVPTTVTGVVHGVNFQPTGYSFYVIDQNNIGINVFDFDPGSYIVTQGDLVTVSGVIDQFNGQLEIIPDQIELNSPGLPLNTPRSLTAEIAELDEGSYLDSDLLGVDSVGNISASGFTIYSTHQEGYQIVIRVDSDAGIGFEPQDIFQGAWMYALGIGTQFDPDFPFTSGYQILALEISILIDGTFSLAHSEIQMNPNPASNMVMLNSEEIISIIEIYSMDGSRLKQEFVNSAQVQLNTSYLHPGLFIIKAITDEGIWTSHLSIAR